jgi:hypothetical protein
MRVIRKKISPWMRQILCAVIINPDRAVAARRLGISTEEVQQQLWHIYKILNVHDSFRAAVKLGILKINYDELPDWLATDEVLIAPGISLKIRAPENESKWELPTLPSSDED